MNGLPVEKICLWDLSTGAETAFDPQPGRGLTSIALSPDGRLVAAAFADQITRVVDLSTLRTVQSFLFSCGTRDNKKCPMEFLRFSPDSRVLVGTPGGRGIRWDLETRDQREVEPRTDAPFVFRSDGGALVTGRLDHIQIDLARLEHEDSSAPEHRVEAVAIDARAHVIAIGDDRGVVRLVDPTDERMIATLNGPDAATSALAFAPSGLLMVASQEGSLAFWSVADRCLVASVRWLRDTDVGYALAGGQIEIWGDAARSIPVCRAGAETLPFEACAARFESPGLLARVLRAEQPVPFL